MVTTPASPFPARNFFARRHSALAHAPPYLHTRPRCGEAATLKEHMTAPMKDRVLVVDDDPAAREVIARLLEEGPFETVTAASGADAIALLSNDDVSIGAVLTDVSMPDMTGVELAYWVRDNRPMLPVAIISGDINALERSVVARAGVPFLKKPVRAEALHTAIREAIRQAAQV